MDYTINTADSKQMLESLLSGKENTLLFYNPMVLLIWFYTYSLTVRPEHFLLILSGTVYPNLNHFFTINFFYRYNFSLSGIPWVVLCRLITLPWNVIDSNFFLCFLNAFLYYKHVVCMISLCLFSDSCNNFSCLIEWTNHQW